MTDNQMKTIGIDFRMCVIMQQASSGDLILAAYSSDEAPFLGGCAQNMVDEEEGIWWGDTEKTKCVSNREDVKGLTFVLTDNKADCNKGWFRKQVPAMSYELV